MKNLSNNWFYHGNLDFEYKKYLLLAYLQYVNRHFKDTKLYPCLGELVNHYRNLHSYLENKRKLDNGFPKLMEGIDIKRLKFIYKKVLEDESVLETIEQLVSYSMPLIKDHLDNGKEIYEFIEDNLDIFPVGVVPMHKNEGYLILANQNQNLLVYGYEMSIYTSSGDNYRSISTTFIKSYKRSIVNTYNHVKYDLITRYRHLPNPATYVVESSFKVPIRETLLPMAKKMLVAQLI